MKFGAFLICCLLPALASAATLKSYTVLSSSVVRLSDLFDGADDRPIGPAPEPGGHITVEWRQLSAIARMFHVDWHPGGSGDRARLERPGRSLGKSDVMASLRAMLNGVGAPQDSDIELPAFTTPLLPLESSPSIDFNNTSYDAASGRFTTLLVATMENMPPIQVRLSGRVQEMTELPVARRAMRPGDIVGVGDLQWARIKAALASNDLIRTPVQAEGQALRHAIQPGQPIRQADLGQPLVVSKGAPLLLQLNGPGLQITAQGVASEAGGVGEKIHVINPYSRAVMDAIVTGPGQARVVPTNRAGNGTQVAAR